VVCLAVAWAFPPTLSACTQLSRGAADTARPEPPEPLPVSPPKPYTDNDDESGLEDICKIDPAACPTLDMKKEAARPIKEQIYAVQTTIGGGPGLDLGFGAVAPAAPPPPPQPIEVAKQASNRAELIDLEARVELEVERIASALEQIRALVRTAGGQVVNEVVEDKPGSVGAALSLRVPTPKAQEVLFALGRVGKLLSRKVESRDVGREFNDAQILARNLDATIRRYEELLKKANDAKEMLAIEAELSRVRGQLDRVQGDLRYLADRTSRATLYVTLTALKPDSEGVEPVAKLHLGLRGSVPLDFSGAGGTRSFAGGGLSLRLSRAFSFDADWGRRLGDGDGLELFMTTLGGELYSELLGGGRRRTFNPYIGLRLGYARLLADDAFSLGATLGIELFKSDVVMVEVEARTYALFGLEDGTHALIQPGAAIHLAY
jgi:hypothetical protein